MKKSVKAWTVVFKNGYQVGEITFWSSDLHPIFTKRYLATAWSRELKETAQVETKVVPCTITYTL